MCDINRITSTYKSWLYQDMLCKPEEMVLHRPHHHGGLGLQEADDLLGTAVGLDEDARECNAQSHRDDVGEHTEGADQGDSTVSKPAEGYFGGGD